MLKIERTVLPSPEQWEIIIEGMRNPKNSWHLSDSYATHIESANTGETTDFAYFVGEKDMKLMTDLAKGGPVHAKYRRMIPVYVTITAPLYWWKEFDTYKVGTVCNSCSTMHKLPEKEFTLEDFSFEHLVGEEFKEAPLILNPDDTTRVFGPKNLAVLIVRMLNASRLKYLEMKERLKDETLDDASRHFYNRLKEMYWWQMIQMLTTAYNQKRTIMLNYEVLVGIYKWRRDHKLDEWHVFCDWIENLPYSELITGKTTVTETLYHDDQPVVTLTREEKEG